VTLRTSQMWYNKLMLKTSEEPFITAGELARLAQTTKRTVLWYTKAGILKPRSIRVNGYNYYAIDQIIDLQVIMLLRRLNFSLAEIKKLLRNSDTMKKVFVEKQKELTQDITKLQKNLEDIKTFYNNLDTTGLIIKPAIKQVPTFTMYFLPKVGPYSKIYDYCLELKSYFSSIPDDAVFLVLFPERIYSPKKDSFKIGVVATKDMILQGNAKDFVQKEKVPGFKSLQYRHIGSPALISMLIMQMHTYMEKAGLTQDLSNPINELEFYIKSGIMGHQDEDTMISEINIPIK
jgi:DNA-binding transcriptional MerR regulator